MIVRATAHPAYLTDLPLLRPRPGLAPLVPATVPSSDDDGHEPSFFGRDFTETGWLELDDDAHDLGRETEAADAALLRCVGCAAFATLVLALLSSLQLA